MPALIVERKIVVEKPVEDVAPLIENFRRWADWSPWLITDPEMKLAHASDGKSYTWDGKIAGAGMIERTAESSSVNSTRFEHDLTITRPFKSKSRVIHTIRPVREDSCEVTWRMEGSLPFFLFFLKPMTECMCGMDFQRGLTMLKDLAETDSVPSELAFSGVKTIDGCTYVGLENECLLDEIATTMAADIDKLFAEMKSQGIEPAGPLRTVYTKWKLGKGTCAYRLAQPVTKLPADAGALVTGELPSVSCYVVEHTGAYRHLGNAWAAGMAHGRAKVFAQSKQAKPFEVYISDPTEVAEEELVTHVCLPAKG